MTRRRVFIIAGEYSASPRELTPERRRRDFFGGPHPDLRPEEVTHLFFRYPNRGDEGRTRPEDWEKAFNIREPVALPDLLASAAHRALTTLHALTGRDWRRTCDTITDMLVTSMPGLDPNERVNIGLVPQALQVQLGLSPRARAQFVVGTSDSGAQAFSEAVRAARTAERPATMLVLAGQVIPSGYVSQYQIRSVLGENDQANGLDISFQERTPDAYTAQFNSGEFKVGGSASLLTVALADSRGVKVKYLFNLFDFWGAVVTSRPEIKTLKDLEGKQLAGARATTNYVMFEFFAKKLGVDVSKIQVVNTATPGLVGYALANRADAVQIWEPAYTLLLAKKPDIRTLDINIQGTWKAFAGGSRIPYLGVAAHSDWADQNPALVAKVYATYKAAAEWIAKNPDEAAPLVAPGATRGAPSSGFFTIHSAAAW